MRTTLFRPEAVEFVRERPLGDMALMRPPRTGALASAAAVIAVALIAFACFGQYTRKAHVTGYLAPTKGIVKVYAPSNGTVITKHVKEGAQVKRGDPLFVLSTDYGSLAAPQAQAAAIAQLRDRRDSMNTELAQQSSLAKIDERALHERIAGTEEEARQLSAQIALQRARVNSAQATVDRYRKLLAQNFVSEAVVQQKQDEHLEQQAHLQTLLRNQVALQRDLDAMKLDVATTGLKAQTKRESIAREVSALDQQLTESEARRIMVVSAPADGTVTTVLAEEGQSATTTTPLLSILPAGAKLQAQLLIPSRSIGFIVPAQQVALRYQAYPYQRFGLYHGRVTEVSKTLISPGEAALPVQLQEPAYRVTVALDSQSVFAYQKELTLQAGMLLDADVLLDRRRLIEWVFDPLFSLTRRV